MRTRACIGLAAVSITALVPAIADALVDAKVKPEPVHPADTIRVKFKSPKNVKPRFHLRYTVFSGSKGNILECTLAKVVQTNKEPAKGDRVRMRITPRGKNGVTDEWCVGDGSVSVSYVRDSDNEGGRLLATGGFNIARP